MKYVDYKKMGIRIRKQRELLGYTREQLSEKLDVSTKFCSDIELGVKGVSIQTLAKLSELLCLSADYILFGECPQGNSIELTMLSELCLKCPADKRTELLTIVHAFVNAVSKS
ncbi:MAG: helix-turn-helix transcriptional regulator [Ruminococcus callidus]|nr:helix-turn-helix transcriptional regulator [Ruminococcus callidus]